MECIFNIEQGDLICPQCQKMAVGGEVHPICKRNFGLDGLWSLGLHNKSLRQAVIQLKYKWVSDLADKLTDVLIEYWARYQPYLIEEIKKSKGAEWVIVPVPLHKTRLKWRGFNQSALLGQLLSKKIGVKYADIIQRTKNTIPQVKLQGQQRRKNLKNAFSLAANYQLRSANILLIDDVWTTGSTLKECCYILKREGAKKVWAITLAR